MRIEADGFQPPKYGLILLQALVLCLFCVFVLRFWYLQILNGENFVKRADANRWGTEDILANRGLILDDNGIILAENSPAYSLAIIREECSDIPATLAQISAWTDTTLEKIVTTYEKGSKKQQSFKPLLLVNNITFDQLALIEGQAMNWPGVTIVPRSRRLYTNGSYFAHVLGYVSVADDKDLETFTDLKVNDTVGKQGLELVLEDRLRGDRGSASIERNAHMRQLDRKVIKPASSGEDIRLSLDLALQKAATAALGDEAGCIVVMEPDTGKLRALVTTPSYDNNIFTSRLSEETWQKLSTDIRHPLYNRVIQSTYPPGSVWKLLMASLFLEEGIKPSETVFCSGETKLGNRIFRCWKRGGHGKVDMQRSIVESCDTYYYHMADRIGIDKLTAFANASGFGKPTGIDLPHEKSGNVPSRERKMALQKEPWQRGDTFNTSIGQGITLTTPVQMAVYVSSLMNGGKLMKPLLLDAAKPEVRGKTPSSPATQKFVFDAMRATVEARSGTAKRIIRSDAIMGGKTGTAQVVKIGDVRLRTEELQYMHRDHAWMVSWGIKGDKKYVVVAMVEHGGGGSSAAGPVCRAVYDFLFSDDAMQTSTETPNAHGYLKLNAEHTHAYTDNVLNAVKQWAHD